MNLRPLQGTALLLLLLLCGLAAPLAADAPADASLEPPAEADLPPAELILMLREAGIAELENRDDDALAQLRAAEEAFPHSILPVMKLWEFHKRHKLGAEEEQRLRDILTRRLADPESPVPPGTMRFLVEHTDASEKYLGVVLDAVSNRLDDENPDPRLLEAIGILEERLGLLPEARETFGLLLEIEPDDDLRQHCLALDRKLERWEVVAAELGRQVDEDAFFLTRMYYIEVLAKIGDHEEVVRQFDLLSESPDLKSLHMRGFLEALLLRVAWDLRDAGREAEAENVFRKLLKIDPENIDARNAILHLYSSDEDRLAHQAALEASWAEEDEPELLAAEGASTLLAGDAARAFELLDRAAAALPDSEFAWYNLGLAAIQLERWDDAERAMEHAIGINPSRAEAYLQRGAALQRLDRCDQAVPMLEQALSLDAAMAQAHYYLYQCHRATGNPDGARHHLELYNDYVESTQD